MFDRSEEIDQLATHVFMARHFCTRDIVQPTDGDRAREVLLWMELNDFDVAPVSGSNGGRVVFREALRRAAPSEVVTTIAVPTLPEYWLDADASLHRSLELLRVREWLLVRRNDALVGILTRGDLASPVVSTYLLARLLGMERGLRRLYGTYSHQPIGDEAGDPEAGDGWSLAKLMNRAAKLENLLADLGAPHRKTFETLSSRLIMLRNRLAHGSSVLTRFPDPEEAIGVVSEVEMFVVAVQRLSAARDDVWQAFADTIIVDASDATKVLAGPGAMPLPLASPLHVITAHNPHEKVLTETENKRRHRLLREYLAAHSGPSALALLEVIGRSSHGPWAEDSWAISGLSREQAVRIGGYFQQRAIFELTKSELHVVAVDGSRFISRERAR